MSLVVRGCESARYKSTGTTLDLKLMTQSFPTMPSYTAKSCWGFTTAIKRKTNNCLHYLAQSLVIVQCGVLLIIVTFTQVTNITRRRILARVLVRLLSVIRLLHRGMPMQHEVDLFQKGRLTQLHIMLSLVRSSAPRLCRGQSNESRLNNFQLSRRKRTARGWLSLQNNGNTAH